MSAETQFLEHARTAGIPVPLHPEIRAAYSRIGQAVPVQTERMTVALPPLAGECRLDGFDGGPDYLCPARRAHDQNLIAVALQNRAAQWRAAEDVHTARLQESSRLPVLLDQLQQLEAEGAALTAKRADVNAKQGHSHCAHCGAVVQGDAGRALHAVAGFEQSPLRVDVRHCEDCLHSPACAFDQTTPGSGHPDGSAAGFCQYPGQETTLGLELVPGARFALRAVRWLLTAAAAYTLAHLLVHSEGQQVSDLVGDTGAIAVQDSTSGHGYNAGTIRFLSGAAPADADAAETGTNLVDVTLPNPLFGAPTGLPSVATANSITAATILASGTVGYGRVKANGGGSGSSTTDRRLQITAGTSGADANFNTLSLVSGGSLTVTSLTYQHAA